MAVSIFSRGKLSSSFFFFFRQIFSVEKWTWQTGMFLLIRSPWCIAFPAAVLTHLFSLGKVADGVISSGFVVQAVKDPDSSSNP